MKTILVLACLVAIGYVGWREQETVLQWMGPYGDKVRSVISPSSVAAQADPAPASGSVDPAGGGHPAKAAPAGAKGPSLPDPPPPGVYYLKERIRITSGAGIRAHAAGQQVTVVTEENGVVTVSDGKDSFPVDLAKLTRDIPEVMRIRAQGH